MKLELGKTRNHNIYMSIARQNQTFNQYTKILRFQISYVCTIFYWLNLSVGYFQFNLNNIILKVLP